MSAAMTDRDSVKTAELYEFIFRQSWRGNPKKLLKGILKYIDSGGSKAVLASLIGTEKISGVASRGTKDLLGFDKFLLDAIQKSSDVTRNKLLQAFSDALQGARYNMTSMTPATERFLIYCLNHTGRKIQENAVSVFRWAKPRSSDSQLKVSRSLFNIFQNGGTEYVKRLAGVALTQQELVRHQGGSALLKQLEKHATSKAFVGPWVFDAVTKEWKLPPRKTPSINLNNVDAMTAHSYRTEVSAIKLFGQMAPLGQQLPVWLARLRTHPNENIALAATLAIVDSQPKGVDIDGLLLKAWSRLDIEAENTLSYQSRVLERYQEKGLSDRLISGFRRILKTSYKDSKKRGGSFYYQVYQRKLDLILLLGNIASEERRVDPRIVELIELAMSDLSPYVRRDAAKFYEEFVLGKRFQRSEANSYVVFLFNELYREQGEGSEKFRDNEAIVKQLKEMGYEFKKNSIYLSETQGNAALLAPLTNPIGQSQCENIWMERLRSRLRTLHSSGLGM